MNLLCVLASCTNDTECNYGTCEYGECVCFSQYYEPNCRTCISFLMEPANNCSCQSPLLNQEQLCESCTDSQFLNPFTLCTTCYGQHFDLSDNCNSCLGEFDFTAGCERCIMGYSLYENQCLKDSIFKSFIYAGIFFPAILAFCFGLFLVIRKLEKKKV